MKSRLKRKNFFVVLVCVAVLGPAAGVAKGRTIMVRLDGTGDYTTIQDAIDDCNDGDEVVVADGTYTGEDNRDIDFGGRAITVRSENGPNNCIIDCQNSGGAFDFESGEDANSIVEGFTLINGKREGIFCHESSPTITNCIITNNWGDGIFCHESSPTITNCTISDNRRGGIFCRGSSLTIANCTISGNSGREGGGICCWESSPTITNCTITGNLAHGPGGGIFCRGSSLTITNCTISGNSTRGDGGAIFFSPHYEDDTLTITGSTITGNSAGSGGGAIACYESSATITDCTISENTGGKSGGIYCEKVSLVITDCIISKNTGGKSGGIYCEKAILVITDCIISKNTGEWSGGIYCTEGSLDITGCTIAGNSSEGEWALGGGISCVFAASPTITNCAIIGNSSKGNFFLGGGGIIGYSPFISDCIIAGNSAERGGGIICGGGNTTITNCIITGNLANEHGGGILISGDHTTIVNCTFAGNSALNGNAVACDSYEQCYPSELFMVNSILWDGGNEIWNNDGSTISINYSDVQGGYTGEENIDADPCFVEQGYWDVNDMWVEGDYHLLPISPCIDAGADAGVYDDIEGNVRPFDYPGVDNNGELPEFDMGAYEVVPPPLEVPMHFTPQALNPGSRGKWLKAHFVLPEGFVVEDVDANVPATLEPVGIESDYINVFINEDGLVEIEIAFDRAAFCGAGIDYGPAEVTVVGQFVSGQEFIGRDTIKILANKLGGLASFASYWLQTCRRGDWCGGVDLDHSSTVDFVDFALFDDCCIEVIKE